LLLLLASWLLLISPKRADAAELQTQTATQVQANLTLRAKVATLKVAQAGMPVQEAKLADFTVKVPGNPQMPALIRQLNAIAAKTDVEIDGVTPALPAGVVVASPNPHGCGG